MNTDPTLLEIIDLCFKLDKTARQFYLDLSNGTKDRELVRFWRQMSSDEGTHCRYWESLLSRAEAVYVPQPFDQPDEIRNELETLVSKNIFLNSNYGDDEDVGRDFILSYRLEFCLLHPAFMALFHLLKDFTFESIPEEDYKTHLDRFVNRFIKHATNSLELELAGDILKRLHTDNKDLAHKMGEVKRLSGLLPICANCKKIRDQQGSWHQLESYISAHTDADFSHGLCPECQKILYPKLTTRGAQMDKKPSVSMLTRNIEEKKEGENWRRIVPGDFREKVDPSASERRENGPSVIEMRSGNDRGSGKERRHGQDRRSGFDRRSVSP